jgi:hypothetical protein
MAEITGYWNGDTDNLWETLANWEDAAGAGLAAVPGSTTDTWHVVFTGVLPGGGAPARALGIDNVDSAKTIATLTVEASYATAFPAAILSLNGRVAVTGDVVADSMVITNFGPVGGDLTYRATAATGGIVGGVIVAGALNAVGDVDTQIDCTPGTVTSVEACIIAGGTYNCPVLGEMYIITGGTFNAPVTGTSQFGVVTGGSGPVFNDAVTIGADCTWWDVSAGTFHAELNILADGAGGSVGASGEVTLGEHATLNCVGDDVWLSYDYGVTADGSAVVNLIGARCTIEYATVLGHVNVIGANCVLVDAGSVAGQVRLYGSDPCIFDAFCGAVDTGGGRIRLMNRAVRPKVWNDLASDFSYFADASLVADSPSGLGLL